MVTLSQSSIAGLNHLVDQEAQSLASSDAAESMLLVPSVSEVLAVVGDGKETVCSKPSPSISRTCGKLLDVMNPRHS